MNFEYTLPGTDSREQTEAYNFTNLNYMIEERTQYPIKSKPNTHEHKLLN